MSTTVDPTYAIELVRRGISLTAFKPNEDGRKVPWCKGWNKVEKLPIVDEHGVESCIREGCHGFQFRAIDAGLVIIDIDRKGGKDGLESLESAFKLHGVKPAGLFDSGYVVATPNDGYHITLKSDEWTATNSIHNILLGVDLLCDQNSLVTVPGSIGVHKPTGEVRQYKASGHIDNALPIPVEISSMFKRISDNAKKMKEDAKQKAMQEALSRQKSRQFDHDGSIFEYARKRINLSLINDLFGHADSFTKQKGGHTEFFTLNPLRNDKSVGSFSIRDDGVYSDFYDDHATSGDLVDLISKAYNMSALESANMIIKETGGDVSQYDHQKSSPLVIGKKETPMQDNNGGKEDTTTKEVALTISEETKSINSNMFPLKRLNEFTLEDTEWLVDRLLESDSLALVYGAPGSGKSFWTLDLSLCIATGKPFHGNDVSEGAVIYMAGEGHKGINKRAIAWQKHHGIDATHSPWWLAGKPFDLIDTMSVDAVLTAIDYHTQGVKPKMIVIDTLARNFGSGDENKTSDMGNVIRNADAMRVKYECLVIIVHHSGHDSDRARGSSALKAAMDFEYCVSQPEDNVLLVSNTRMKDGDKPEDMCFRLTDIELGKQHKWGAEMKSAVLVEEDKPEGKKNSLGGNQKLLLELLTEKIDERKANLRGAMKDDTFARVSKHDICEGMKKHGMIKNNVYRLIKTMSEKNLIKVEGDDLYVD